jgi:hypothetical protein
MVDVGDDGDVAKIFDGHTKGGQSAPDLEKEVQHYTSNLTIREKVDFTPVTGPIQLGIRRLGRGRQDPAARLPVRGLKRGASPMVEAAADTRRV